MSKGVSIFRRVSRLRSPHLLPIVTVVCFTAAFASSAKASSAPVILVTIDTLRADHVGSYGDRRAETHTLDDLARAAVLFEHAYSNVPMTVPSHAVMMTGTYPGTSGVRDFSRNRLPASLPTLAELFRANGYRTAAFVSAFVVSRAWGFDRGFDAFDDYLPRPVRGVDAPAGPERKAEATIGAALAWLGQQRDSHFFLWVHLFDPHYPYTPPQPYRTRFAGRLYDGEIAYADAQLGRLFSALKQRGWFKPAIICVTGDHGESLGQHGEREHAFFIYDATLRVPLLIKLPAGPAHRQRVQASVSLVDIAPTLTVAAGLAPARHFEGHSLLPVIAGAEPMNTGIYAESYYARRAFGWHEEVSWREGKWKLIDSGKSRLYNLAHDPQETNDLSGGQQALVAELHARLDTFIGRFHPQKPTGLSAAALEELSSLGYVSAGGGSAAVPESGLPDPVRMLPVYQRLVAASDMTRSDRHAAAAMFRLLLRDNPNLVGGWFAAGQNALSAGLADEAADDLHNAIRLQPDFEAAYLLLAWAEVARRDLSAADKALVGARAIWPQDPATYERQGEVELLRHQRAPAEAAFKKAIELGDPSGEAYKQLGRLLVHLQRFSEAAVALAHATEFNRDDAALWNTYAVALANSGDSQGAIHAYKSAIAIEPKAVMPHVNLAYEYGRAGDREGARREQQIVCRLDAKACNTFFGAAERRSSAQ